MTHSRRQRSADLVERFLAWKLSGLRADGESLKVFSDRLGMSKSTVHALLDRYEAGPKVRAQLLDILGMSMEQLCIEAAAWSMQQRKPLRRSTGSR